MKKNKNTFLLLALIGLSFAATNFFFNKPSNQIVSNDTVEVSESFEETKKEQKQIASKKKQSENCYILENDKFQLVFSSKGASLKEINLLVGNKSLIKPVSIDSKVSEKLKNSNNQSFYHNNGDKKYHPLLRRNIFNDHDIKHSNHCFSLKSNIAPLSEKEFTVSFIDKNKIVFEYVADSENILVKTFSIEQSNNLPYCINVSIKKIGFENLEVFSGLPEAELISGKFSPIMKNCSIINGNVVVDKLSLPREKTGSIYVDKQPHWILNSNGYFGLMLQPLNEQPNEIKLQHIKGNQAPSMLSYSEQEPYNSLKKYPGYSFSFKLPRTNGTYNYRLFAGPIDNNTLKTIDNYIENSENEAIPYFQKAIGSFGMFSFITRPFASFLFFVMNIFHSLTSSWGLSIILLTVVLRILLYPLNAWSIKNMRKTQQLSPEIQAIQEKYKNDKKRSQAEVVELYKLHKVNPLMGCIPVVIQIPFLMAMFDVLKSTFSLRGSSFLSPWITDLTAPDVIFSWNTSFPIIGNQLHLLPLLLCVAMFLQQKATSWSNGAVSPANMTEQQRQQQAMGNMMSLFFSVMFYNFPAGLNLYWLFSILLGIAQQLLATKTDNLFKKFKKLN